LLGEAKVLLFRHIGVVSGQNVLWRDRLKW
jgi:hypothetical protein